MFTFLNNVHITYQTITIFLFSNMEQFFSVLCFFLWLIFSKVLRNPDFHADTKWSHIKSQNDLNAACYFLTIQFSVLIDHILVQEKEIASSLRQPANHTSDNQLIRLSKIPQKFSLWQILFIFLIDKVHFDKHCYLI